MRHNPNKLLRSAGLTVAILVGSSAVIGCASETSVPQTAEQTTEATAIITTTTTAPESRFSKTQKLTKDFLARCSYLYYMVPRPDQDPLTNAATSDARAEEVFSELPPDMVYGTDHASDSVIGQLGAQVAVGIAEEAAACHEPDVAKAFLEDAAADAKVSS